MMPVGTGGTTGCYWDDVNRLTGFSTTATSNVANKYRAAGMRVSKLKVTGNASTQTQATFYDGQMPVETVDFGTTNTVTRNFVGARGIEAIFTTTPTSDTTSYPLYDAHGNMTSTLSKAGNSYVNGNVRTYDVWGGIRSGATTAGPNNRYCASLGHVQDDESGLIYMRARYYEPGTGRFANEDPARRGMNLFIYAGLDPVNSADQSGKSLQKDFQIAAEIVGMIELVERMLHWMQGSYSAQIIGASFFVLSATWIVNGIMGGQHSDGQALQSLAGASLFLLSYVMTYGLIVDSMSAPDISIGGQAVKAIGTYSLGLLLFMLAVNVDELAS